jgi:hypothetical protein
MRVLQVLTEVVRAEELFRLVALAEFVDVVKVLRADVPLCWIGELVATVAADVGIAAGGGMKCGFGVSEGRTAPTMAAKVERVLVSFCFVFVLKAVGAVGASVLLFGFV